MTPFPNIDEFSFKRDAAHLSRDFSNYRGRIISKPEQSKELKQIISDVRRSIHQRKDVFLPELRAAYIQRISKKLITIDTYNHHLGWKLINTTLEELNVQEQLVLIDYYMQGISKAGTVGQGELIRECEKLFMSFAGLLKEKNAESAIDPEALKSHLEKVGLLLDNLRELRDTNRFLPIRSGYVDFSSVDRNLNAVASTLNTSK